MWTVHNPENCEIVNPRKGKTASNKSYQEYFKVRRKPFANELDKTLKKPGKIKKNNNFLKEAMGYDSE